VLRSPDGRRCVAVPNRPHLLNPNREGWIRLGWMRGPDRPDESWAVLQQAVTGVRVLRRWERTADGPWREAPPVARPR
jgi:hypothetical protein